jgi:uncharacterized membrane protein YkvA (DUF1232 family)
MQGLGGWRAWARRLKTETLAVALAYRDPRTPWYARLVAAAVVAYALSPLDLVPDFVPVLGYLDDLLLVPLGLALAMRLIPPAVLAECRTRAQAGDRVGVSPRATIAVVVVLWLLAALAVGMAVVRLVAG